MPPDLPASTALEALLPAEDNPDFVLVGVPAIAKHLGESVRAIHHLISLGSLPVFKLPGSAHWRLRPSRLRELYRQLESEGMAKAAERRALPAPANGSQEAPPAKPKRPRRKLRHRSPRPAK
jgi:hypothetical protein